MNLVLESAAKGLMYCLSSKVAIRSIDWWLHVGYCMTSRGSCLKKLPEKKSLHSVTYVEFFLWLYAFLWFVSIWHIYICLEMGDHYESGSRICCQSINVLLGLKGGHQINRLMITSMRRKWLLGRHATREQMIA